MKKKLAILFSLALVLVALCTFASAATELELQAPNGQGLATPMHVINKAIDAQSKALVDLYPKRGATVSLWYWNDGTGCYNVKNGKQVDQVRYTVRGNKFYVKVVSGSSWLGLHNEAGFGNFSWDMKTNKSTSSRTGKIRVYDRYGTICYIEVQQACRVKLVSVRQLKGKHHNGRVRVEASVNKGIDGKLIYNVGAKNPYGTYVGTNDKGMAEYELTYEEEQKLLSRMKPKKHMKGSLWYQENRKKKTHQYYYVKPYRTLGGKKLEGPMGDILATYVSH